MTTCPWCSSREVAWVGYTKRALRKLRPSMDVMACDECGRAWYWAKTGRPMRTRKYVPATPDLNVYTA